MKGTLVEFIDGNGDLWHWKVKVDEVISGKGIQTGDVVRVSDHAGTHAILKREQGTLTLRPVDPLQPARGWRVQAAQY